jgi:hypothetical protein
MKEQDIKRLIIQMLIMKLLKERFETQTVRGTSVKNIIVYIQSCTQTKPALLRALEQGKLPVYLTDGSKKEDRAQIDDAGDFEAPR